MTRAVFRLPKGSDRREGRQIAREFVKFAPAPEGLLNFSHSEISRCMGMQDYETAAELIEKRIRYAGNVNGEQSKNYEKLAFANMKLGDLKGAFEECAKAIEIDRQNMGAVLLLGRIYYESQEYEKTISLLEQNDNAMSRQKRVKFLSMLARAKIQAATNSGEKSKRKLLASAKGDIENAIKIAKEIWKDGRMMCTLRSDLGKIFSMMNKIEKSLEQYSLARECCEEYSNLYKREGISLYKYAKYCLSSKQKAIMRKANRHREARDYRKAQREIKKFLRIEERKEAVFRLVISKFDLFERDAGIFEEVLNIRAYAYREIAIIHLRQIRKFGRGYLVMSDMEEHEEISKSAARAGLKLGGDLEKAIDAFEKYLKLNPECQEAAQMRGWCIEQQLRLWMAERNKTGADATKYRVTQMAANNSNELVKI